MGSLAAMRKPKEAIGQALSQVLSTQIDVDTVWVRYSDADDFTAIWRALEDGDSLCTGLVVIIWDQTPYDAAFEPVTTGCHLSPLEWAFCARKRYPDIKVLVLDLAPSSHSTLATYRLVQNLRTHAIPWLRLVPLHQLSRCFSVLLGLLADPGGSTSALTAEDLLRQVRLQLTETGHEQNRHALTNIVGGVTLAGAAFFKERTSIHTAPLLTLFREANLLLPEGEARNDSVLLPDKMRLILVDDQAAHGWLLWLRGRFQESHVENLWEYDKPTEELIARIAQQMKRWELNDQRDIRFRMTLSQDDQDDVNEVLLLDLRLFSGQNHAKEARFYRILLSLAEFFIDRTDLPWPSFQGPELQDIRNWCETVERGKLDDPKYGIESEPHHLALTLLPRLLSLLDFSYPIIIFSSTGQRKILDILRPYENIILDFAKPRFFGAIPLDLRQMAERDLVTAIGKAQRLNLARSKCRYLLSLHEDYEKQVKDFRASHEQYDALHAELYLDESGPPNGDIEWVGGCFALWGSNAQPHETMANVSRRAREEADRFNEALVEAGVRYFDTEGLGPGGQATLEKGECCVSPLAEVCGHSEDSPLFLGALRLHTDVQSSPQGTNDLVSPEGVDNRFRFALEKIIELFLSETLPALKNVYGKDSCEVSTSIFPGTRVVDTESKKQELMFRWGFEAHKSSPSTLFSFDRKEVYPIMANVFKMHTMVKHPHVHRALAIRMIYASKGARIQWIRCRSCNRLRRFDWNNPDPKCQCRRPSFVPDYRALHYAADEILRPRDFPDEQDSKYAKVFSADTGIFGEFSNLRSECLDSTLSASRAFDNDDAVRAVAFVPLASPPSGKGGLRPSADYWLSLRIGASLPAMLGTDFLRLAEVLDAELKMPKRSGGR